MSFQWCYPKVVLNELSTVYVPYDYDPEPKFKMFAEASEQITYDPKSKLAYTIGGSGYLHVVDVSNPKYAKIISYEKIEGVPNDIDTCGGYVAATVRHIFQPLPGKVVLFEGYTRERKSMRRIRDISVGNSPASMITFTKDCRKILVANEGEAGKNEMGKFFDPEGGVSVISFSTSNLAMEEPSVKHADFTKFNKKAKEYVKKGIRWVYKGERTGKSTRFSQDIEPEYLALSPDEKLAYVILQENNAMAILDVEKVEFLELYPLGFKYWPHYGGFDASDKDKGIHIEPWPVYGMYQPDAVKLFVHEGKTYLVTANEGDKKIYTKDEHGLAWSETTRGATLAHGNLLSESMPYELVEALYDPTKLGRLRVSLVDGREKKLKYKKLYAYGGRSFTIWSTDGIQLIYDSGCDIERRHAEQMPLLFNSHVENANHLPIEDADYRSDDHGPEVEIVETGVIDGVTYIFVGNQRVSTLIIYSLSSSKIKPVFEGLHRGGDTDASWKQLFEERRIGDSDLQDLR